MIDVYEYGDLKVDIDNLHDILVNRLGGGEYNTEDILVAYRGAYENDVQTALGASWDVYFGEILKQCEGRTGGKIIKEVKHNDRDDEAATSLWKVFSTE
ncbi:hypothetical protein [Clostridium ganghwense]|uniref:Uncharacterized protein n=1 Tax=Clostridium ganghwense TaxID=312089 RepID=A0ABT4CWK8_9CLOT|nr:hypothetical protein [Clostridium ganghwense]MCY6372581.1 hypothetical protein [Clostridium ganghwense]